jgi:histone H3/H4
VRDKKSGSHFDLSIPDCRLGNVANAPTPIGLPSSGETLPAISRELSDIKYGLGFVNSITVDRRINREAKKILAEGYMQLMEAKRQELMARITIGLSEAKKKLLVESLRVSGEIDKEIAKLSAQFAMAMFNGALAANLAAAEEEQKTIEEIELAFKSGRISEDRYHQLRETTNEAAGHLIDITKNNVSRIIQDHVAQMGMALELFRERALSEGI